MTKASFMIKEKFKTLVAEHRKTLEASFDEAHLEILEKVAREILATLKAGRKILLCGNGGSAADSQHIAAEFIGRFKHERRSLPAIALTTDTSILTAIGNDYGYDQVFSRQIEGLGEKGDLLIAISTSGNSPNVLEAVAKAKSKGLLTIGFTNQDGGKLKDAVDVCYKAASKCTSHVQEMHITALHAVSEIVEDVFFGV